MDKLVIRQILSKPHLVQEAVAQEAMVKDIGTLCSFLNNQKTASINLQKARLTMGTINPSVLSKWASAALIPQHGEVCLKVVERGLFYLARLGPRASICSISGPNLQIHDGTICLRHAEIQQAIVLDGTCQDMLIQDVTFEGAHMTQTCCHALFSSIHPYSKGFPTA
jgi:hypothetical protein